MDSVLGLAEEEARLSIKDTLEKLNIVKNDPNLLQEMVQTIDSKRRRLRNNRFAPY